MATPHYDLRGPDRLNDSVLARYDMLEPEAARIDTILHGPIRDQAGLHGVLQRVQSLGRELLEVRRLPD